MRLYQMRDKIIYGTVRQYHIWFILCQDFLPNFIDIPSSLRYNYSVMVQINGTTRCKEVFIHGKNDIPAEQPLEKTDPRFPCSYENKSRPYCSEEKKSKGQKGIKCLIKKSARRGWGIHCPALLVSDRTGITVGSTDPANVSAIGPGSAMW